MIIGVSCHDFDLSYLVSIQKYWIYSILKFMVIFTSYKFARLITHGNTRFSRRLYVGGVIAISSLIFPVNTSNDYLTCRDVIFSAQVAGMHCDYQNWPLRSYPVDPVNPVHVDFCPGFASCRLLRDHVHAPCKNILKCI